MDPAADDLRHYLQQSRERLVGTLDGLGEHDVRRPLTPSGSNLLGLVKHLVGVESGYLGDCVGRPSPLVLPWNDDGSVWDEGDMWAQADESRGYLLDLYRRAWAHSDATVAALPLGAPARVPWWPAQRRTTTLGHLLARTLTDTAQHAGQADILRETLLGTAPADDGDRDAAWWRAHVARVQASAGAHRDGIV